MINDVFSPEDLRKIAKYPHLIGWMVGKDRLTAMHSKWIRDLWLPERHTCLQAHRGAYKTTACTEVGIVWRLLFHPDHRIALIRETWAGASDTLKTISTYMQHELIQELFRAMHGFYPKAITDRDGRLTFNFKGTITKEGSVDAYGVDTVPTGSHYDDILGDDFVTIRDRFSRAKRERTKENIREIMTNILDPGKYFRAVGTPWAKGDAWEILPPPMKYDVYATGILSLDQIEEKKLSTTAVMYAANYELIHQNSDDMLFADPEMGAWSLGSGKIVAHIDASYGGRDTTAVTIMQRRAMGGIQGWGKRYTGHVESNIDKILADLRAHGCRWICMETNGDKGFLAKIMRKSKLDSDGMLRTETYHEKQNKHIKITSFLGHHWHDIVWAPSTDPEYLAQIVDYTKGAEPDDAPDSASSLLREVFFPLEGHSSGWRSLYKD